ncbi:hypothetical protein [Olivibacter domesticus]|nr:hypothetical protein [Olivibacter domesticus]
MMLSNKNSKINIDVSGTGKIETLDVLRQGDVFVVNIKGDQLSIIRKGGNEWSLVNGVADQESVDNIGDALKNYFGL